MLLQLAILGMWLALAIGVFGVVKSEQLRLLLKDKDPVVYARLGSPTGLLKSPYLGGRMVEFNRYIYSGEFLNSSIPEIRALGKEARAWMFVAAALLAILAICLVLASLKR